jgi:hypothetical protein
VNDACGTISVKRGSFTCPRNVPGAYGAVGAKNHVALSDGFDVTVLRARMTVTALALSPCEPIRRGVLIGPDKTIEKISARPTSAGR